MSIASHMMALMYHLPPVKYSVDIKRDVSVIADDGVALKTDIYTPRAKGNHPTIMMRTPYGRLGFGIVAEAYSERGFITVLQACRGTDGSGGDFDPLINERTDGLAMLKWIKQQNWFDGRLGLSGPSYLGYVQWAICDELPANSALSAKVTSSDFESVVFPGGAFHLQLWLSWMQTIYGLEKELFGMTLRIVTGDIERRTNAIANSLPLAEADVAAVGEVVPFWRNWLDHAINNPQFWEKRDHKHRLDENTPPNCFVSGWYDIMVDQHIADYLRLVKAGNTPHLTIGPWFHTDNEMQGECLRQTISWMRAHLMEERDVLRKKPVRLFVSGINQWRDYQSYPVAITENRPLYLVANGALVPKFAAAPDCASDTFTYDPYDPTPNVGGAIFAFIGAGAKDNRELEARPDVLTYTSSPLANDLTIIGNARVRLYVRSSNSYTDFFARLCDVDKKGVSINVSDAIIRLIPGRFKPDATGIIALDIKLHATAHSFLKGHSIRLQVSSGAHPRFARNLGTNEPIGSATTMVKANQEVFFNPDHQSALILPIVEIS
ncbi:X-Pro dipeptidyl-peptidase-like [hydrothermal vent metagenome]|uniref:X-Pro dipeptidyl-peptidase-like n=1 Tax=hydrothermal vent metagenome TaxID=652676 RepID=A0A3B0TWF7_9ZZZZ